MADVFDKEKRSQIMSAIHSKQNKSTDNLSTCRRVSDMGFWASMLAVSLLLPIVFIIVGKIFSKNAPAEISNWIGYRTTMSKKNDETWKFAHKFVGKFWFIGGLVVLPLSLVPSFFVIGKSYNVIGIVCGAVCGCQLLFILVSIICTEVILRKHFDNRGNAK